MKPVNVETVAAEVARLEEAEGAGGLTLKGEFTLAAFRKLLAYEQAVPIGYVKPGALKRLQTEGWPRSVMLWEDTTSHEDGDTMLPVILQPGVYRG